MKIIIRLNAASSKIIPVRLLQAYFDYCYFFFLSLFFVRRQFVCLFVSFVLIYLKTLQNHRPSQHFVQLTNCPQQWIWAKIELCFLSVHNLFGESTVLFFKFFSSRSSLFKWIGNSNESEVLMAQKQHSRLTSAVKQKVFEMCCRAMQMLLKNCDFP